MKKSDVQQMRAEDRKALLQELAQMVSENELSLGDAARFLRTIVLGIDRSSFAKIVGISQRSIAKIEDDPDANPTLDTLNRIFAPFGAKLGLTFPHMDASPPDEVTRGSRAEILATLNRIRRKRKRFKS
jgi:DNA-binding XRE family transcriptional regulator